MLPSLQIKSLSGQVVQLGFDTQERSDTMLQRLERRWGQENQSGRHGIEVGVCGFLLGSSGRGSSCCFQQEVCFSLSS